MCVCVCLQEGIISDKKNEVKLGERAKLWPAKKYKEK